MITPNSRLRTFTKLSLVAFILSLAIILPVKAEEVTSTPDNIIIDAPSENNVQQPPAEEKQDGNQPIPAITVNLNLRLKDQLLFSGPVTLSTSTEIIDSAGVVHSTTSTSVLTALIAADKDSANFSVSNIQFYDGVGFYVKCIDTTTSTPTSYCDNSNNINIGWNYVVNGIYPSLAMDSYPLQGGENIYVYYGNSWQITASTTTPTTGATTTFYTWRYNYDNLDNEWAVDGSNLIDLSIPNPNPTGWSDTTLSIAQITSDENGQADYIFNTTGTYYAKITSADWSKWSWPITIQVTGPLATTSTTSTAPTNDQPPTVGGGGSSALTYNVLNVSNAINYLNSQQNSDGSFGSALHTDWAALAYGAYGQGSENKNKLKQFLLTDPDNAGGLNPVSDLARRAMALMSLGINPYTGTKTNYIQKILDSYSNSQFGDPDLYNDDIFALIPLLKAGFSASDEKITNSVKYIISKQAANGSWEGVDLTSAAIQILKNAEQVEGATAALTKAQNYLHNIQQADGGFNNAFSTAWAVQAGAALDETDSEWMKKANNYLYTKQLANGSVGDDVWATAQAIPAVLGKPWLQFLTPFSREITNTNTSVPVNNATDSLILSTPTSTPTSTLILVENTITPTSTTTTITTVEIDKPTKNLTAPEKLIVTPTISPTPNHTTTKPPVITLSNTNTTRVGEDNTEGIINSLPLDTPTRRTAKKIAQVTGGGAAIVGLYLGLRILKNVV